MMLSDSRHRTGIMAYVLAGLLTFVWAADSQAQTPPENIEAIRKEFGILAPYMSMDKSLELETLDAGKTTWKLVQIGEYSNQRFESHPLLEKVGQLHMKHMVHREQRIVPIYEPQDFTFEDVLLGGISEINAQNVLRQW